MKWVVLKLKLVHVKNNLFYGEIITESDVNNVIKFEIYLFKKIAMQVCKLFKIAI